MCTQPLTDDTAYLWTESLASEALTRVLGIKSRRVGREDRLVREIVSPFKFGAVRVLVRRNTGLYGR